MFLTDKFLMEFMMTNLQLSEMEFKINTIKFIPNREKCSAEFMLPKHKAFRQWCVNKFNKTRLDEFKQKYYAYLENLGAEILFVTWFKIHHIPQVQVLKETKS